MDWHLFSFATQIAQATPTPKPSTVDAATIELLTRQLQFLQDANSRLSTSFTIFVNVVGFLIAGVVGIGFWLFKNTLSDARQEIKQLVSSAIKHEIETIVEQRIRPRISYLKQLLDREHVLKEVTVDYVNLQPPGTIPIEYEFLEDRFPRIAPRQVDHPSFRNANVIVLDLINNPTGKPLPDETIRQILTTLIEKMDQSRSSLVLYYRGEQGRQSAAIAELDPSIHAIPANGRIALIGSTINAAYIADTLRRK